MNHFRLFAPSSASVSPIGGGHMDGIGTDEKILNSSLPDYLLKYVSQNLWISADVIEIARLEKIQSGANLYMSKALLKADDPNLIFGKVREVLSVDSFFAFKISTAENIKASLRENYSPTLFWIYYFCHFVGRRVLPKLKGFKNLYRLLSIPVDVSKAEILGRLIYQGFIIVDLIETSYETIFVTRIDQSTNPSSFRPKSNEGVLFKMQRVGKNGKPITVYKFRSMHPYAEYVQAYMHQTNGLDPNGKFKNDFRVSTGGRLLRKYWIDELPMLYNLIKGDIKLIGVRPISEHYFSLYPTTAQAIRQKYKPGLLPPFYADMPHTFTEIVASEMDYLNQYRTSPLKTDLIYLKRILVNIIIRRVRSK